ncbi:MAG: hypothetical protein LUC88_04945 [Prevotella sp.]|nr:hypothetical protein [Prevotella sp.]
MESIQENQIKYQCLKDVTHRKEMVLAQIKANNKEVGYLWKSLFAKQPKSKKSKGSVISNVLKTGVGVFDAVVLAWKVYRKFKK